ncbi:HisA/HisF-related TIM barrel protein [Candidatus Pelagibacter sp.]|jgi:cyclase|nr:HisA/HisF-related TIM barrel protein [Candidatus Pelagibacter sp.]|tara:strand:- start:1425 stop:2168 length:744 start_codon:yes stop_codon:yes gene_type:complete
MLRARIIPFLLVTGGDLIKTTKFQNENYIGDPLNTVRIFNEKKCDEISIFDIKASTNNLKPNYDLIRDIANEARMPVTYGGGIKNRTDAIKIFNYGIEKISVSSLYFENRNEVSEIIESVGSQSTVVTLDIKLDNGKYSIYTNRGKKKIDTDLVYILQDLHELKVGEIVINNIDREGTMEGYDHNLIKLIYENTKIPITILGGVSQAKDIQEAIGKYGSIGYGCSSFFIYKGPRKAVLISYKNTFHD